MSTTITQLTPQEGYQRIQDNKNILFLDIRSYAENKFVGRTLNTILLPYIDEPNWEINPEFCQLVGNLLVNNKKPFEAEIILLCRSGIRSLEAGNLLIQNGYRHVAHIRTGFEGDLDENHQRGNLNGWRHDGLPWEQC